MVHAGDDEPDQRLACLRWASRGDMRPPGGIHLIKEQPRKRLATDDEPLALVRPVRQDNLFLGELSHSPSARRTTAIDELTHQLQLRCCLNRCYQAPAPNLPLPHLASGRWR